jgi:hypothetical protein
MEVKEQGWTVDAVAPIVLAVTLLGTMVGGLLYYMTRPINGVDPSSREAWAMKVRPVFKVIVPASIVIHVVLAVAYLLGSG